MCDSEMLSHHLFNDIITLTYVHPRLSYVHINFAFETANLKWLNKQSSK